MSSIPLFRYIDFETISTCNRVCPTCIRNSHPNRDALSSWFEPNYLPVSVIVDALNQCIDLGFMGGVCLSHFNEPLLDNRIADIARIVRSFHVFNPIFLHTNGDFLSEKIANDLDGSLDLIIVTLYMEEPIKSMRAEWVRSLFKKTKVEVITHSKHIPSHFSPAYPIDKLIAENIDKNCLEPQTRIIINHRQQYLLCCEDVIGNFNLGRFPDISIEKHWFEDKWPIISDLSNMGGRHLYPYCSICPKP